jgi:hypothetical protein
VPIDWWIGWSPRQPTVRWGAFGPDTLFGDHVGLHNQSAEHLSLSAQTKAGPAFDKVPYVAGIENPAENFHNIIGWLVKRLLRDPSRGNLEDEARAVAAAHEVDLEWRAQPMVHPVPMDESIRTKISAAADALGLRHIDMPSGAGLDAQNMVHLAPTAMIFIPSKDGRSHSPAEHTDFDAIERGANVLLMTLIQLASK